MNEFGGAGSLDDAFGLVPAVPVPEPAAAVSQPGTTTWIHADHAGTHQSVTGAVDALAAAGGSRNAAAMAFMQGVAYALIGPAAVGSLGAGAVPALNPAGLWLGFGPGGFCERVAYERLDVVTVEAGRFEDRMAESVVAVLEPIVETLHQVTGLGHRVLWSTVPDSIAAIMLTLARRAPGPADALPARSSQAWLRSAELIDAFARHASAIETRPRPFRLAGEHGGVTWMVRGGCCFVYRDAGAQQYCVTCPVLDDDARRDRLGAWLAGSGP